MNLFSKRFVYLFLAGLWMMNAAGACALRSLVAEDTLGITFFELQDQGLYWSKTGGVCLGEFPITGAIRYMPYRFDSGGQGYYLRTVQDCKLLTGASTSVVRDENYLYFFFQRELVRLGLLVQDGDVATFPFGDLYYLPSRVTLDPPGPTEAPLTLYNGRLYYPEYLGMNSRIRSVKPDGSDARYDWTTPSINDFEKVQCYSFAQKPFPLGPPATRQLIIMQGDHSLYWHETNDNLNSHLIGSDVRDYAIRRTSYTSGVFSFPSDEFWVVQGPVRGASINRISLTGTSRTYYTASASAQINSITTYQDQVYFVETSWDAYGNSRGNLYRLNANDPDAAPALLDTAVDSSFTWVRADRDWVYWVGTGNDRDSIWKMSSGAAAIQIDLAAGALEVVQAVQTLREGRFNNRQESFVPLVAGKKTFARGYASIVSNTSSFTSFTPGAKLTGRLNGNDLGSVGALNNPVIDAAVLSDSKLQEMRWEKPSERGKLPKKSFLFELPEAWVAAAGNLELTMEINPTSVIPETSRVNNSVSLARAAQVVAKKEPCLMFVPILTQGQPTLQLGNVKNLNQQLARAASFMPYPGYRVHTQTDPVSGFRGSEFTYPDNQDAANFYLYMRALFSSDPPNCDLTHWIGMVPPGAPQFNGLGISVSSPGIQKVSTVRMEGVNGYNRTYDSPAGGVTIAHETTHNYGRKHVHNPKTCGQEPAGSYDDDYPYDTCNTGRLDPWSFCGFDPIEREVIPPAEAGDLMSYASNTWMTDHQWNAVIGDIPNKSAKTSGLSSASLAAAVKAAGGDMLFISGYFPTDSSPFTLLNCYVVPGDMPPLARVAESLEASRLAQLAGSSYSLVERTAAGDLIQSYPLAEIISQSQSAQLSGFSQFIPFDPSTGWIQIVQDGSQTLAERRASANAPTVAVQPPRIEEGGQSIALSWDALDVDGDLLSFTVLYSADNGSTWRVVAAEITQASLLINARSLQGSSQARLRVLATDGFQTAYDTTSAFVLATHGPEVFIGGLENQARLAFGRAIALTITALDAEDGALTGSAISWALSGPDSQSGTGGEIHWALLSPGSYTLDAAAVDSESQTGSAALSFEVLKPAIPEASAVAPVLDGWGGDAAWSEGLQIVWPRRDGVNLIATLVHRDAKLHVLIEGLALHGGSSQRSFTGIRVDANASGDVNAQTNDAGYFIDEYGSVFQAYGDGTGGMPFAEQPRPGFRAALQKAGSGWTAELQIEDSLLGGWNHSARIMLAEYWLNYQGDDRNWPLQSVWQTPSSWAPVYFGATVPAPSNRAPIANAGLDQSLLPANPVSVMLDGQSSYDPDGDSITFLWKQTGGPSVSLTNSTSATPSFTAQPASERTVYRFSLNVSDSSLTSTADEVEIVILPTLSQGTPTPTPTPEGVWNDYCGDLPSPLAIPDNDPAGVVSEIQISDPAAIKQVKVSLSITHTWVGDLKIFLRHVESGRSCQIFQFTGCSGDNIAAVFQDDAAVNITSFCGDPPLVPVVFGLVQPFEPLSGFTGLGAAGTWRLEVQDASVNDFGSLDAWCLSLYTEWIGPTPTAAPSPTSTLR